MVRTNSKKARQNVMQYIRQDVDYLEERNEYCGYGFDLSNDDEVCKLIWECFKSEKSGDNRKMTNEELFYEWAQGLALGGLFCYYYNRSAVKDLGDILEESEDERNRFTEEDAERLLTHLIYTEISRRANK